MTLAEKKKLIRNYCHGKNCATCLLSGLICESGCYGDTNETRINERVRRILEEQGKAGIIAIKDYKKCKTFKRDGDYRECETCNAVDCPKWVRLQNTEPVIKDSGDRTEFSTGAVRDMHTGKGRMDLVPVTAIIELSKHCENGALKYGERNVDKGIPQHSLIDSGLRHLFKYLRGDKDENHLVAALWNIAWAVEQEVNKPELNDLPNR